ncbi:MAG: AmmeMemoRadiSam system radical SAM enzyme [Theionarchaea archaeon]|nr:AmmeMemoRadiSam system radical SAM enzyme [Theionarchaea archaeon]MBU7039119.1 AmmeMemoRadiSam system radical SAM enzyme [Theionarchaea archaeon]
MESREPISRRDFIKKSVVAGAAIALGGYGISRLLQREPIPESSSSGQPWKWSKEGYHYITLGDYVKCQVCPNQCVLREGIGSVCRNKTNYKGTLYTLAYGNPCAVHVDPVEKKPLFHFLPSSSVYSLATAGCNFRCLNCQNWEISQRSPEETTNMELFPQEVVMRAEQGGCQSIAYTYSEPTAWYEYMYDTARIATERKIKNIWVTNGYMNELPLRDLCQYLDAANVDLKSFDDKIYHELNAGMLQPVLDTLKILKEEKVWVEITNLVVPTWTDDLDMIREMCQWLYENIGPDFPLHFSRFHPDYKLQHLPPTPVEILKKAHAIAAEEGLHYVYIGNVPGIEEQQTVCPSCQKVVVERNGFLVMQMHISQGACDFCGEPVAGVWSK